MKKYELQPMNNQKSFYKKAMVYECNNGDILLFSYSTLVAGIRNGNFARFWDGYSPTTMKHINAFLHKYRIKGGGKNWWNNQEVIKNIE